MKGPHFLVIGGMKCGSTTLFRDLARHPEICLPEKEMNVLSTPAVDGRSIRRAYARLFRTARAHQQCGDVSTTYSMQPDYPAVPETAMQALGADLRIIYLVREPVSRAISHHYHMHSRRGADHMPASIDRCVREHPGLLNYSRYAMQLAAWQAYFPNNQIKMAIFEDYVSDRVATLRQLVRFLGLSEGTWEVDLERIHNRSERKPVLNGFWSCIRNSPLYLPVFRPIIPAALRRQLLPMLLPQAPPRPAAPNRETVEYLIDRTREDVHAVESLVGHSLPQWSSNEVRRRIAARGTAAAA